ncbi:hypothetical protein CR513_35136, partial [Mucuna pruriens]
MWWNVNFLKVVAIPVALSRVFASSSLASLIPANNASYSAWLLLALNSKWSDCSINTPFGPSNITPAPLPDWLDAPCTDKIHLLFSSVTNPLATISVMKSVNA